MKILKAIDQQNTFKLETPGYPNEWRYNEGVTYVILPIEILTEITRV